MVFVPSRDKFEAVNRISALTRGGPEELGPGSKERKRVLEKVVYFFGLPVDTSLNKVKLGKAIAETLGGTWTSRCYAPGYTITLHGLDLILELAQAQAARTQRVSRPDGLSLDDEACRILEACAPMFAEPLLMWTCVEEMRAREDPNWAQSEWPGFYFEGTARAACMAIEGGEPGPRYGSVAFDYRLRHVWDFKAHSTRMASGALNRAMILNDASAVERCVQENGGLGFVVGHGEAVYDVDGNLREWLVEQRLNAGKLGRRAPSGRSRALKALFTMRRLDALFFPDAETLARGVAERWLKPDFQSGFRQIDGVHQRRGKYQLFTHRMPDDIIVASCDLC